MEIIVCQLKNSNDDGGHDFPGAFGNMDIFADEEIWNFVSKHNIDGLIDCESLSIIEEEKSIQKNF